MVNFEIYQSIRPILAPSSGRCSTNNFYRKDLASSVEKVDLDSFNKQIHINKVHLQNQIGTGAVGHDNSAKNLFWMTTNQRDYGGLGKNCLYVICLIAIQYFSNSNCKNQMFRDQHYLQHLNKAEWF